MKTCRIAGPSSNRRTRALDEAPLTQWKFAEAGVRIQPRAAEPSEHALVYRIELA